MIHPRQLERILEDTHIAFTEQLFYFPCSSSRPEVEHPDYITGHYGHPYKDMISLSTKDRDTRELAKNLVRAVVELVEGDTKNYLDYMRMDDFRYVATLYIMNEGGCKK